MTESSRLYIALKKGMKAVQLLLLEMSIVLAMMLVKWYQEKTLCRSAIVGVTQRYATLETTSKTVATVQSLPG